MSDQSPPPPKPKPGSLRDRIAAFEKSASTAPTPGPAPAVRPKPAGFSSWKPKAPSPPSSPPAASTEHASSSSSTRAGGMSASDAKESITKAGSLKDRMAALQGKGAFGAPPPVAPKPAVEKPKWKPPPVVQAPVDDDDDEDHQGGASTAAIAAAVERTVSPPVSVKLHEGVETPTEFEEGTEPPALVEGDNEGEPAPVTPEEEERQRRAAIAARMARLGGARLGMAPPVFGKKPPFRKPTQEDIPKTEEPKAAEEPSRPDISTLEAVKPSEEQFSPPIETSDIALPPTATQDQAVSDVDQSREYFPVRKSSENASILSSESVDSHLSRSPSSMPVPVVPRRAGPPRKKPVKLVAPPPEPEVKQVEEVNPAPVALEDAENASHEPTPVPEPAALEQQLVAAPKEEDVKPEVTEEITRHSVLDPSPDVHQESAPEPVVEAEAIVADKEEAEASPPVPSSLLEETSHILSSPPARAPELDDIGDDEIEYEDADAVDISQSPPSQPQAFQADSSQVEAEGRIRPEISTPAVDAPEEESEAAEEDARKKRVADRLAKMGGINPFAPPPQQVQSARSPPPGPATLISSPPVAPPVSAPHPHPETVSQSLEDPKAVHEESVVESTAEEEASDEHEFEDDDVLDDKPVLAATNEHERPLPHSESIRESVGFASQPPPVPPLGTRPPVQFQQYEQEEDEGSDYGNDDSEPELPVTPSRPSNPPGRPPVSSPPVEHEIHSPSLPTRPAQPPRRIIPQAPEPPEDEEGKLEEEETDEEADERLATSQLFVPPPTGRGPIAIPRHVPTEAEEDGDGSENDSPALPVPHRRSLELLPGRSVPPPQPVHPPALDEDSEPESDHDGQALPIPPRHTGVPPPRVVPPPPPPPQAGAPQPPPVLRTLPPAPPQLDVSYSPTSPDHFTPTVSISGSEEILDEEEGDPIDPSFHSPSRRASFANLHAIVQVQSEAETPAPVQSPPPPPPPVQSPPPPPPLTEGTVTSEQAGQPEEDSEQARRKTIAERMAKLGGIKFGAAPLPTPASRHPPARPEAQEEETEGASALEEEPAALSEEDEERARKARIAAKMANMGGMRIGMMPMGRGGLPPQRSHVLREENVPSSPPPPAPPSRAVPPARPPPPPAVVPQPQQGPDTDSEYAMSEDGVQVEAEESEIEEVEYEDPEEPKEELEEAPPPVPARTPHRQASMDKPTSAPPIPSPRPPVPTAMPTRRSSIQTSRSTASTIGAEAGMSSPQRKTSSYAPPSQSEYVMVEEPEGQEAPPPPPTRPVSRVPPVRSAPQVPSMTPQTSVHDSISSQWELPSIPVSSLDFGGGADLSLSWTDAGEPTSPTTSAPPPPPPAKSPPVPSSSERQLSADDLIALWGRVGVQVCEAATTLFEKSKKTLIGDGTYAGFIQSVLSAVPNAASVPTEFGGYGYLIYLQNGSSVQKRVSEIMPGDIVEIHDAKLKGHKGLQTYHQNVGGTGGEVLVGVVGEFEAKKSKIRVFHANQHVGQQTVESVSYRLEDLKSGIVKVYRVLDA